MYRDVHDISPPSVWAALSTISLSLNINIAVMLYQPNEVSLGGLHRPVGDGVNWKCIVRMFWGFFVMPPHFFFQEPHQFHLINLSQFLSEDIFRGKKIKSPLLLFLISKLNVQVFVLCRVTWSLQYPGDHKSGGRGYWLTFFCCLAGPRRGPRNGERS